MYLQNITNLYLIKGQKSKLKFEVLVFEVCLLMNSVINYIFYATQVKQQIPSNYQKKDAVVKNTINCVVRRSASRATVSEKPTPSWFEGLFW